MSHWYAAKLLFESEVEGEVLENSLCEESIRVIKAEDDDDAERKAEEVGVQAQHQYLNENGHTVRWHFRRVLEVQDISESQIVHGTEVFSRMYPRNLSS
jgi:hypothetical protein